MPNLVKSHLLLGASRSFYHYVYNLFTVQIININLNQYITIIVIVEVIIQKQFMILLKNLVKSLEMMQEKRLITTVTTTELIFKKNLIPDDQISPK